eukprot:SAG11_NODE_1624_length_4555_cov_3.452424_3_plen_75_part_00
MGAAVSVDGKLAKVVNNSGQSARVEFADGKTAWWQVNDLQPAGGALASDAPPQMTINRVARCVFRPATRLCAWI